MFQLGLLLQLALAGAGGNPAESINIERLSPRVIIAYWVGVDRRCNLTAIQSRKGLVMIDTEECPRVMAPIKQEFEQLFGRSDWAYVINTHAHDSHCSGNSVFQGAVIVGHENLWADMQWIIRRQTDPLKRDELNGIAQLVRNLQALLPRVARNPLQTRMVRGEIKFWELFTQDLREGYEVVKPTLTFPDKYTLDLGDLTLELVYFGKGHSRCDIGIHVPQEKLLVSGAVVYQRAHVPVIGDDSKLEDVQRAMAVLDGFLAEGVQIDHVVPSHSPLLLRSDLPPVRDYYQRILTGVRAARQEGLTLQQMMARLALRPNFPAFRDMPPGAWSHGMHERNIKNLWRILDQEEPLQKAEKIRN
jgi:glyoxylase-like metal-dependent hydrolase (beta-lactamase superfamily II)